MEIKKNLKPNLDTDQRSLLYLCFLFLKALRGRDHHRNMEKEKENPNFPEKVVWRRYGKSHGQQEIYFHFIIIFFYQI